MARSTESIDTDADAIAYRPRPRPEWAREILDIGRKIDAGSVIPLDEESLLRCAMDNTGLSDFGDEHWREPFRILLRDLEEHADLNLFGRLMTRNDLLIHLAGRLRVVDWLAQHPEVEDEVIEEPVFVVGLPRSGTTIMQEILSADPGARGQDVGSEVPLPPARSGGCPTRSAHRPGPGRGRSTESHHARVGHDARGGRRAARRVHRVDLLLVRLLRLLRVLFRPELHEIRRGKRPRLCLRMARPTRLSKT